MSYFTIMAIILAASIILCLISLAQIYFSVTSSFDFLKDQSIKIERELNKIKTGKNNE